MTRPLLTQVDLLPDSPLQGSARRLSRRPDGLELPLNFEQSIIFESNELPRNANHLVIGAESQEVSDRVIPDLERQAAMLQVQLRNQRDSKDTEIDDLKAHNAVLAASVAELEKGQHGALMVGPGFESRRKHFEEALATVVHGSRSSVDDLRSLFEDEQSRHMRLAETVKLLEKQRTEIGNLKARIATMRRQHETTVAERDQARDSLIRQVHALRRANERRFARVRQIHIEEVRVLIETYESRLHDD